MAGMSTWMTDAGPFDVLAGLEAPDGRLVPYEELIVRSTVLRGDGFVIRAAGLEDIIRAKERANRVKDREALPELRRLRDASAMRLNGDLGFPHDNWSRVLQGNLSEAFLPTHSCSKSSVWTKSYRLLRTTSRRRPTLTLWIFLVITNS